MGTITYHVVLYVRKKRPYNKVLDTLSLNIVKVRRKLLQLLLSFLEYYLGIRLDYIIGFYIVF